MNWMNHIESMNWINHIESPFVGGKLGAVDEPVKGHNLQVIAIEVYDFLQYAKVPLWNHSANGRPERFELYVTKKKMPVGWNQEQRTWRTRPVRSRTGARQGEQGPCLCKLPDETT